MVCSRNDNGTIVRDIELVKDGLDLAFRERLGGRIRVKPSVHEVAEVQLLELLERRRIICKPELVANARRRLLRM